MVEFEGQTALVTGAAQGIGKAIAAAFVERGANVAVCDVRVEKLESFAREVAPKAKGSIFVLRVDLSNAKEISAFVAEVESRFGGVDILVNNAAVNQRKPFVEYSPEEWRALHAANLDGPFLVTRAIIASMQSRRRGKIINICSLASDLGRPNIVPYAASKGAIRMLTRALAVEVAPHNIQVNGIAPGFFRTEMNAALTGDAEFSAWVSRRTPAGRWGEPPEVAGAAVFLASPAADYVTGHILYVDGGFSAAY